MKNRKYIGLGISLGAGIGAALGVTFNNIPLGVSLGTGIGIAVGAYLGKRRFNKLFPVGLFQHKYF